MIPRSYPFPAFPNGWFQVAYSDDVEPGKIVPLEYFGRGLILFRDSQGKAHVLDAYCPHLGAHLGYGGKIQDDTVVCPFHAWRFDACGKCVDIPYAEKIPSRAQIREWPVHEGAGLIMVWYHGNQKEPEWDLPDIPEYHDDEWTPYHRERWQIKTRHQEMAENAVDSAHFRFLHGTTNQPQSRAEVRGPILHVYSDAGMSTPRGGVDGSIESISYGFGFSTVRFKGIVETLLVSSGTAIKEDLIDIRFSFSVKKLPDKDVTKTVGKAFIAEVSRQLEQDIPIWENKIYLDRPVLCGGDGPIGIFRKWSRQFYSLPEAEAATP